MGKLQQMFLTFTVLLQPFSGQLNSQPLINIHLPYITAPPFFTVQGGSLLSFAKYGTEQLPFLAEFER